MYNRVYLAAAAAVLLGAPLVVNGLSNAIPETPGAAAVNAAQPAAQPSPASPPPPTASSAPPPSMAQVPEASANAVADVTPSLDPQGIEPASIEVTTSSPGSDDTQTP